MADYKELFGSLVNMAKDVMESTGVTEVYQKGASPTKAYSRIARLTLDTNSQAEELRKVYTEIGRLYVEQNGAEATGFFAPLCAQAAATAEKIRNLEDEIRALRESVMPEGAEKDIEVEIGAFDDVVSADEDAARGE